MTDEELISLTESIRSNGFDPSHPIVLFEGRVLEGRNRHTCCKALHDEGIEVRPVFADFAGDDALRFVLQENLTRRQLSTGQKVALAVEMLPPLEEKARERQAVLNNNGPLPSNLTEAGDARDQAAKLVGVANSYVSDGKRLKLEHPETFEELKRGRITMTDARRMLKRADRPEPKIASALPSGEYSLLYADPPWGYDFIQDSADAIENHYRPMELEAIRRLPVAALAASDAVLFLWATAPKLPEALSVMEAWGFTYKSQYIWHKSGLGLGFWGRVDHEILLIGTRGNPGCPKGSDRTTTVVYAQKSRHSEKPDVFRERIAREWPAARRVELFARGAAPEGWTFWGNQIEEVAA